MGNLVSRQIPSLFNGVSQQPATIRLPSQGEEQINGYATVAEGLYKRPPTEHVARFTTDNLTSAHLHTISRDTDEQYIVVVTDGDLKVYDLAGVEQTVSFPLGKLYLDIPAEADAASSFSVVTIADYSFVLNRTKPVATKTTPNATPLYFADWYFPNSWLPGVDTPPAAPYYNPDAGVYRGSKQTFADLPKTTDDTPPVEGDLWKIAGFDENSFGAYYVVRRNGVWEETIKPGLTDTLDESSMPWALVRQGDGTFVFTVFPWKVRKIGDEETNPHPTFVGRTINDVFYYKNRLGFVSDENVVFSGAGDFGNFYRSTATDLLDGDVIDVAVSSTKVSVLNYAVPFANSLMLFADQLQFRLNTEDALTPQTVSIDVATEFEVSDLVRPLGVGPVAYFTTETGGYTRVREYFVEADILTNDAADITAHVPRYLPKRVSRLAGNGNEDVMFALSAERRDRLYVYKFFWGDEGKIQSSWSHWQFPETDSILTVATLANQLFLVVQRTDGAYIEKCNIQPGAVTGDLEHQVLLDRLTPVTGVYAPGADETTFTLPYPVEATNQPNYRLVRGSDFSAPLSLVDPTQYEWTSTTTVVVPGDHADGEVWAGQNYTFRWTFSEQFVGDAQRAITTGRLMLRTFVVYYARTAFFKTEVAPYGNDPLVEEIVPSQLSEFTGKTLGSASLLLNTPNFASGTYAFQVYGDSKVAKVSLVNDTHVQSIFQSCEWEGLYHNRARPL